MALADAGGDEERPLGRASDTFRGNGKGRDGSSTWTREPDDRESCTSSEWLGSYTRKENNTILLVFVFFKSIKHEA